MSGRAELLKKGLFYKPTMARKFRMAETLKSSNYATRPVSDMRPGFTLCLERARYLTQSYKATEGEPMVIRRAKALKHILENMTIYIGDGELLVGNFASTPHSLSFYPEVTHHWLTKALNDGLKDALSEEGKKEYREMARYWNGKSVSERVMAAAPEELKDYIRYNGACFASEFGAWRAREIPNTKRLFHLGLKGIMAEVEARLSDLKEKYYQGDGLSASDYVERSNNYNAMLIALKAVIDFGKRYAVKAGEMAQEEKDANRKEKLLKIAEVCDWVPGNPPRTLHEAMQSYFLCNLVSKVIECQGQGLGDRIDVLLNPFYQKDKAEGRVTKEGAVELMECLYVKMCERGHAQAPEGAQIYAGSSDTKDWVIGGVTPEGDDATNEFSFIVLDAAQNLIIPEPTIALRYHSKIDPELVMKVIDVIHTGVGYPAIFNDSAYIPFLISRGIPLELARDWGIWSCVSPSVPGKSIGACIPNCGVVSLGKCLELALYQGKDKDSYTGKQLGVKTPDPRTFTSIEDVMDAYLAQVGFIAQKIALGANIGLHFHARYLQRPFSSALLDDCMEKGKDCTGYAYNSLNNVLMCGSTNTANSLAAIKKFIFDGKTLTWDELIEACRTNFEGKEELRQRLINEAPKFGNDDDYVDLLARQVHVRSNEEFMKAKDYYGFPLILDGSIAGGYHAFSVGTGALPDGKKDSEPLADAVISPCAGTDKKGPTAVLKSVSKVTPTYCHLFNQRFMPQFLEGENKKLFAQYLRTWFDLGISHIQFNVVNRDTLLDAQAHPEKYADLVVRVAGYSAYFIDLSKEIQDDIIRRTEQRF